MIKKGEILIDAQDNHVQIKNSKIIKIIYYLTIIILLKENKQYLL